MTGATKERMAELRVLATEARRKKAIEKKEANINEKEMSKKVKIIKKIKEEPRELDLVDLPTEIKEIIEPQPKPKEKKKKTKIIEKVIEEEESSTDEEIIERTIVKRIPRKPKEQTKQELVHQSSQEMLRKQYQDMMRHRLMSDLFS